MTEERISRHGLYRLGTLGTAESWAQVRDMRPGRPEMPFSEDVYRERGYQPPFETLPTRETYLTRSSSE